MIDPRLQIPEELLQQVRQFKRAGRSLDDIIALLHDAGLEAPGAKLALVCGEAATSSEAKRAIHLSAAYASRRSADEAFEEESVSALHRLQAEEHRSSAAA